MKLRFASVLSCLALLTSMLSACDLFTEEPSVPVPTPESPSASAIVCLVTDTQGIDDRSFNATAWKGVTDAQERLNVSGVFLESNDDTYYDVNISAFIQGGCDLIVTVGFLIGEATANAAGAHPEQKFAIVDYDFFDFTTDPPVDVTYGNVVELTFLTDQAAFLAGYVAAAVTQSGKVGTFGGVQIPTVTIFMDGYFLGVQYYNQRHNASVEVIGWDPYTKVGLFTDTFDDVQKGRELTELLIGEGVDIVMPVAGGVGLGAAAVAREFGSAYIIGVDTDWTVSSPEYADILLTSVLKNMDVVVFDVIRQTLEGAFQPGLYIGTLANDGVGLAPFHQLDMLVSDEIKSELEVIKAEIIAGNIQPGP